MKTIKFEKVLEQAKAWDTTENASMSKGWDAKQIKDNGWVGFRTRGPQPIIASSVYRKRTQWYVCEGYSS